MDWGFECWSFELLLTIVSDSQQLRAFGLIDTLRETILKLEFKRPRVQVSEHMIKSLKVYDSGKKGLGFGVYVQ
jgi:hypothetical protein